MSALLKQALLQEDAAHREMEAKLAQAEVARLRDAFQTVREALTFSRAWAAEHAVEDHCVTLDHKDEVDLARLVLAVHQAVAQATPSRSMGAHVFDEWTVCPVCRAPRPTASAPSPIRMGQC